MATVNITQNAKEVARAIEEHSAVSTCEKLDWLRTLMHVNCGRNDNRGYTCTVCFETAYGPIEDIAHKGWCVEGEKLRIIDELIEAAKEE